MKTNESIGSRVARRIANILPRRVAYWAAIRVGCHATTGKWSDQEVPSLAFMDALKRWDQESEAG